MTRYKNQLFRFVQKVVHSIAFVPTVIATALLLFYFLIAYIEYSSIADQLKGRWPSLFVDDAENARVILGTLVGGMISLTVFSFSMVMVVLTRASATLSPRIIPGLITQPQHQRTLGVYIGTIIYSLVLLTNINSVDNGFQVPGLGILFAILLGIISLALFVYFIHSITRSIQVDFVLDDIYTRTRDEIARRIKKSARANDLGKPDNSDWSALHNRHTGYFKKCNTDSLMVILKEHDLVLTTEVYVGEFVARGRPLARLNKQVDEDLQSEILDCFAFYVEEIAADHFTFGFNQMSEIAVKALSPGINDPGTAKRTLNMLSILFADFGNHPGFEASFDNEDRARIFFREQSFAGLLYTTLTPIREYGRKDAIVVGKIVESCINIAYADLDEDKTLALIDYIDDVIRTSDPDIESRLDRKFINKQIRKLNSAIAEPRELSLLSVEDD